MHKDFLEKLGSQIGKVEEIDAMENGFAMGRFARIRIRIEVNQTAKTICSSSG